MNPPDFDADANIDPTALDVEWLEQTRLGLKYCRYLSYLKDKQRYMEERKKTKRSELIVAANKDPYKCCGKEKPNAGDIEAYYRNDSKYQEIVEELNAIISETEFTEMAKDQICWTRKTALENLVKLHGMQYFAGPDMPRNLAEEFQAAQARRNKTADAGIAGALKRKTK